MADVSLYYVPGEAYQFDWSHEVVLIWGLPVSALAGDAHMTRSPAWPP